MTKRICFIPILLFLSLCLHAQVADSVSKALTQIQGEKYVDKVNQQVVGLNGQLTSQSQKYIRGISIEEAKLKSNLQKIDSVSATSLFGNVQQRYQQLQNKLLQNNPGGYQTLIDKL